MAPGLSLFSQKVEVVLVARHRQNIHGQMPGSEVYECFYDHVTVFNALLGYSGLAWVFPGLSPL